MQHIVDLNSESRGYGSLPVSKVGSRSGSGRRKATSAGKVPKVAKELIIGPSVNHKPAYLPILHAELLSFKLGRLEDAQSKAQARHPSPTHHAHHIVALPSLSKAKKHVVRAHSEHNLSLRGPPKGAKQAWNSANTVELGEVLRNALSRRSDPDMHQRGKGNKDGGLRTASRMGSGRSSRVHSRPISAKLSGLSNDISVIGGMPPVCQRPPSATIYRTAFSPQPEQSTFLSTSPSRPRSAGTFSFVDNKDNAGAVNHRFFAPTADDEAHSAFFFKNDHDMQFHLQEAKTFLHEQKENKVRFSNGQDPTQSSDQTSLRTQSRRGKAKEVVVARIEEPAIQQPSESEVLVPLVSDNPEEFVEEQHPFRDEPVMVQFELEPTRDPTPEPTPEPPMDERMEPKMLWDTEPAVESVPASSQQSLPMTPSRPSTSGASRLNDRIDEFPATVEPYIEPLATLPEIAVPSQGIRVVPRKTAALPGDVEPIIIKDNWNLRERELLRAHGCIATSVLEKYVNALHTQTAFNEMLVQNKILCYKTRNEDLIGKMARKQRRDNISQGKNLHLWTAPGTGGAAKRCEAGSCWKNRVYTEIIETRKRFVG
ncbi:hypothetical protein DFJ77DRAFT_448711, partial [Powellomyces hirtus]